MAQRSAQRPGFLELSNAVRLKIVKLLNCHSRCAEL